MALTDITAMQIAYLLGVPITGYSLDISKEHVSLAEVCLQLPTLRCTKSFAAKQPDAAQRLIIHAAVPTTLSTSACWSAGVSAAAAD